MSKGNVVRALFRMGIVASALTIASAGSARPGADPIYDYYYYSDATHTTQVGYQAGACYNFGAGVNPHVRGQVTAYYETEQVGWCQGGIATYF